MQLRFFRQYFIFLTILVISFEILGNDLLDVDLEKRCDKRERLLDEKENESLSPIKVHKNYLDALLKRVKSKAEDVSF